MSLTKEISRWGNTPALRIPQPVMRALGLALNSRVELKIVKGALLVTPVQAPEELTLEQVLKGATPDKCRFPDGDEWVNGAAVGGEML